MTAVTHYTIFKVFGKARKKQTQSLIKGNKLYIPLSMARKRDETYMTQDKEKEQKMSVFDIKFMKRIETKYLHRNDCTWQS